MNYTLLRNKIYQNYKSKFKKVIKLIYNQYKIKINLKQNKHIILQYVKFKY